MQVPNGTGTDSGGVNVLCLLAAPVVEVFFYFTPDVDFVYTCIFKPSLIMGHREDDGDLSRENVLRILSVS